MDILTVSTTEVLAFDWGINIIGVLDVNSNEYVPYYGEEMIQGARRIVSSLGTIVSFNGDERDLSEISKILGLSSVSELNIGGEHNDMLKITSDTRWPPDPGSGSICGPGLLKTYQHYFGDMPVVPPLYLKSKYENNQLQYVESNWMDCYMAAELWKKWKLGALVP